MNILATARKENLPKDLIYHAPTGIPLDDIERLKQLGRDESKLHLIGDMKRLGVNLLLVKLEYSHFPPRSCRNKLFELTLMKWPVENQFLWSVTSIPISYRSIVEDLTKECGLRVANGIPTMLNADGYTQFPLDGKTVFTFENSKEHAAYKNDRKIYDEMLKKDQAAIERIILNDKDVMLNDLLDEGFSERQALRIISEWEDGNDSYREVPERQILEPGKSLYQVYHWDTFENENLFLDSFDNKPDAFFFVEEKYKDRISQNGADRVDIVKNGHVLQSFSVL